MDCHADMFNVTFALAKDMIEKINSAHWQEYDKFEDYTKDMNDRWERAQYLLEMAQDLGESIDEYDDDDLEEYEEDSDDDYETDSESDSESVVGQNEVDDSDTDDDAESPAAPTSTGTCTSQ